MKNNIFFKYFVLLFSLFLINCAKDKNNTPGKGNITVIADKSFKNVTEALTERYMAFYPETKINVRYAKEDSAFEDLLNNKADVIIMSRELTADEKELYTSKVDLPFEPARFAGDATVFIVAKNSPRNSITIDEIRSELLSDQKKIIFDGARTGNFNFISQKLNIKPEEMKFSVIKGNENVINEINNYPESIGVISYNTISNPYTKEAARLRDQVKILQVVDKKGVASLPNQENIRQMKYPFTRILYFLTNEGYFGLGNGFIRFSCTQVGQIVVSKEGLQPYNIFKREVQMR